MPAKVVREILGRDAVESIHPLLASRITWCFSNDPDFGQAEGFWDPSYDGSNIFMFPSDAPPSSPLEPGEISLPPDLLGYERDMEGIWTLGRGHPSGAASMAAAWSELSSAGFSFDLAAQKLYGQDSDFDALCPLEKKVFLVIPELIAQKEAAALASASSPSKHKKPARSPL